MPVLGSAYANLVFSPCFTAQIKKSFELIYELPGPGGEVNS